MKVQLITIGDEILIGQIVDTNSAWMAQQLNLVGAQVTEMVSVSDESTAITEAIESAFQQADAVLLTGGLGPTKDDITKKTLATFLGQQLVFHEATYDRICRFFERIGKAPTEAHRHQSYMPEGAELLHNKMGTAPGMWMEYNDKVIVSMPGVPYEMKYLMESEVLPRLKDRFPSLPIAHRTLLTAGEGESRIAKRIEQVENGLPSYIKLAYLPNLGQVRLRLSGSHENEQQLNQSLDQFVQQIKDSIPELIFGEEEDLLSAAVGRLLQEKNWKLSTAESCTGGHLAHLITTVPGSSAYFWGSVVAYDNRIKQRLLNVQTSTLEQHGAVSEETVKEMVVGALELLKTDVSIAISGIAGPGGGTEAKPVGTIWMAVGTKKNVWTKKLQAGKNRLKNIEYATSHALNFIRQFLLAENN